MSDQMQLSEAGGVDIDSSEVLSRVGAQVLETMFFDEAVATACNHAWIASAASVRLVFEGSHRGQFLLSVASEVARSIAPAFLGIDPEEVVEEQSNQVLLELANILCGSVLSRLWPESDLTLEAPESIQAAGPLEHALHKCFLLPEGMLSVSIRVCAAGPGQG